jgi:hypothetical protein
MNAYVNKRGGAFSHVIIVPPAVASQLDSILNGGFLTLDEKQIILHFAEAMGYVILVEWIKANPQAYEFVRLYGYAVDVIDCVSWNGEGRIDKDVDYHVLLYLLNFAMTRL